MLLCSTWAWLHRGAPCIWHQLQIGRAALLLCVAGAVGWLGYIISLSGRLAWTHSCGNSQIPRDEDKHKFSGSLRLEQALYFCFILLVEPGLDQRAGKETLLLAVKRCKFTSQRGGYRKEETCGNGLLPYLGWAASRFFSGFLFGGPLPLAEVPCPGVEHTLQQGPELQQWRRWVFNLLIAFLESMDWIISLSWEVCSYLSFNVASVLFCFLL